MKDEGKVEKLLEEVDWLLYGIYWVILSSSMDVVLIGIACVVFDFIVLENNFLVY